MIKKAALVLLLVPALALSACGGGSVKEKLGLTKNAPDEFQVVKRAPLSMPPDYSLRPPQPGAARPQEQDTTTQAKEAIFGQSAGTTDKTVTDDAESSFLKQAGGDVADPSIRNKVDAESKDTSNDNKPVIKKILGGSDEPSASVVNANEEAARLRANKEQGKPVTAGKTPTIEE